MTKILEDGPELTTQCKKVSLKEGLKVAHRLNQALDTHNKNAKRLTKSYKYKGHIPSTGIGLAAPQIGVLERVCVVRTRNLKVALVNPRITAWSNNRFLSEEGCLSLPNDPPELVYRHFWVTVEADNLEEPLQVGWFDVTDQTNSQQKMEDAACVQHEIAHLDGLLIFDFRTEDYPTPDKWSTWKTPVKKTAEKKENADE